MKTLIIIFEQQNQLERHGFMMHLGTPDTKWAKISFRLVQDVADVLLTAETLVQTFKLRSITKY